MLISIWLLEFPLFISISLNNNKIMNFLFPAKTIEQSPMEEILAQTSRTIDTSLHSQIKDKYRTFTNFNYREAYKDRRLSRKKKAEEAKQTEHTMAQALATFMLGTLNDPKQEKNKKNKKAAVTEELAGIKSERRERFRRANNTFHIIKHYIQKQNFKPREEEMYLMKSLAQLKEISENTSLDNILKKIYKFMNEAVDFNELRLLCLLVVLSADLCYQNKDFKRAFYFYNQAKLFASYSDFYHVKTESLVSMGSICMEMKFYSEAIKIFKKALQYAWKTKNVDEQLLIYDMLGSAYYYQGDIKESQYYHRRFTQGEFQKQDSAIKRISTEMLYELSVHLGSLQKKNITSLFIEYINIPIVSQRTIAVSSEVKRAYENYDEEGLSPRRKKKSSRIMEFGDFQDVPKQIQKLFAQDFQFRTQIPNPDVQRNFLPEHKFGKIRKNMIFEQTAEYHKIMGHKENKLDLSKIHSKSLQKRIEEVLSERENKDWWQQIKDKIKMNQLQKVGRMRDRVYNAHLSFYKYPQERRRCSSLKTEKIKQSFNKSLLDWIDPPK